MDLTDEQWAVLDPLIGEIPRRADGRGRPWRNSREVLNGILWILRTGAQWVDLPDRYPPYQTCHRRYQRWVREGVFERILEELARDLKERGKLDLSECFIDGTFIVAKKGEDVWIRPSGARVRSSWQWQTALVFLSPRVPPRLRLMRVASSLLPSTPASSPTCPDASLATAPMTPTRWMRRRPSWGWR
jgi:transposase